MLLRLALPVIALLVLPACMARTSVEPPSGIVPLTLEQDEQIRQ